MKEINRNSSAMAYSRLFTGTSSIIFLLPHLANSFTTPSRQHVALPQHFSPTLIAKDSQKRRQIFSMSAVDDVNQRDRKAVLEDVDGIGQLTTTSTTSSVNSITNGLPVGAPEAQEILNELLLDVSSAPPAEPAAVAVTTLTGSTAEDKISPADGIDIVSPVQSSSLMDPSEVVELVIGSAMDATDTNGVQLIEDPIITEKQMNEAVEEKEESVEGPSLQKIIKFAIPAIGVWLCSPLLSLIDTSSVGLLSGTAQQAALNPAVAVTDYGALLVAFMYTATTNLVASAQNSDAKVEGKPQTAKTLVHALQLSVYVGAFLGTTLITFARPLLRSIIGNDAIDPEVFAAAMRYVRIRALGMPAAVVIGSAQSACLGMQDIKTPLYVLAAAATVNFLGDMIFVPCSGAWLGGAAGAAWATVFSQYAALGMFMKWLLHKSKAREVENGGNNETTTAKKVNLTNAILELTGKSEEGKLRRRKLRHSLRNFRTEGPTANTAASPQENLNVSASTDENNTKEATSSPASKEEKPFSARGFLAGRFSFHQLLKFPPREEAKVFRPYFVPVTTTAVGRVSSYVAMSHVVSSSLGTLSMAANQIIVSLFYCLTPVADSLNLTAQSFIPGLIEKKPSLARNNALRTARRNFIKSGFLFGGAMAAACSSIQFLGKFFTSDPIVISQVNAVVPLLAATFGLHGVICSSEGLLLGQKDLSFLGKAYAAFFVGVPFFMLRVKSAALSGVQGIGLQSVWKVFLGYQMVRCTLWLGRLQMLQHRRNAEAGASKNDSTEISQSEASSVSIDKLTP